MSETTAPPPALPSNREDESHLNALAIAHYVVGGFGVLFACFPLIHVTIGALIASGEAFHIEAGSPGNGVAINGPFPPAAFGWIFVFMGGLFFLIGQAIAIGVIVSGRFLKQRRNYMYSFVVACLLCMIVPIGTALGVFTIIVLSRDSVKRLYTRTF